MRGRAGLGSLGASHTEGRIVHQPSVPGYRQRQAGNLILTQGRFDPLGHFRFQLQLMGTQSPCGHKGGNPLKTTAAGQTCHRDLFTNLGGGLEADSAVGSGP